MTFVATLLVPLDGPPLTVDTLDQASRALEASGAQVGERDWLCRERACDFHFDSPAIASARAALAEALASQPVDLCVQPMAKRRKRLLVADMESTIIGQEMLEEMAEAFELRERMAEITAQSMRGEIDFAGSLRERAAMLKDLPTAVMEQVAQRMTFNPGARTLVATMRDAGAVTALVTGGFTLFADMVAAAAGFHLQRANHLTEHDGRLIGEVAEPILGPQAKQEALLEIAAAEQIDLSETCAVGDGANDVPMVRAAGLGVAYRGKPVLRETADASIDHSDLTALLYFQGYRAEEFVTPTAEVER